MHNTVDHLVSFLRIEKASSKANFLWAPKILLPFMYWFNSLGALLSWGIGRGSDHNNVYIFAFSMRRKQAK